MPRSVRCAIAATLFAVCLGGAAIAAESRFSRPDIEQRAEAAARYLVAVEAADGRFLYEFDFLRSRFLTDDNVVRQAGAGFVLNQFYFLSGKPGFAEPGARAIGYYEARSVKRGDGALISENLTLGGARAGGTALALLAELFHSRAIGKDFRPDLRLLWLKGLAAQQLRSGGIAQRPDDKDEDSYASGETWLALAHYAEVDPDEPALAPLLERLEARVIKKYLERPDNMFAHWGLMAASKRLETTGDARYRDFITAFARNYIRNRMAPNDNRVNTCAALEGLAAAAMVLEQHGGQPLAAELRAKLDAELPVNLALQLAGDGTRLEFGPGHYYEDPKLKNFVGAFLNGAYVLRTRIDSTQHCLSAMLLYRELTTGESLWKM
jgi:hypothetical protein